jgi:hypothetical protein
MHPEPGRQCFQEYGDRKNLDMQLVQQALPINAEDCLRRAQSDDSIMVRRAATGVGMPPVSAG